MKTTDKFGFKLVALNFQGAGSKKAQDVEVEWNSTIRSHIAHTKGKDEAYLLQLLTTGEGYCTCKDFTYRKASQGKPCKHLLALHQKRQQEQNSSSQPTTKTSQPFAPMIGSRQAIADLYDW